eukprot:CAMPEP_0181187722 /NCGR_PEP_ID=MMETSP1096-20121128/10729_1 /TAXON_ID=156174 ORGANISM="Chrysochromulina ericina, Strain CCMP281" /NCGR_SAMPLE_ID=MMETSP1096 /ASSEMBLY_ACC=CAM_ASM_000453 /LENGTH=197 /DNA_ID=CAMNT_0023276725 /DNA_START=455 /DNA_END=1049 /DNA_ORIENTATION=-
MRASAAVRVLATLARRFGRVGTGLSLSSAPGSLSAALPATASVAPAATMPLSALTTFASTTIPAATAIPALAIPVLATPALSAPAATAAVQVIRLRDPPWARRSWPCAPLDPPERGRFGAPPFGSQAPPSDPPFGSQAPSGGSQAPVGPPLGSSVSGMQAVPSLGFRVRSRGGEGSILEGSILEVGEPIFEGWTSRL